MIACNLVRRRRIVSWVLPFVALAFFVPYASAIDAVWVQPQNGVWSDTTNWEPDTPAAVGDNALVDAVGAAYTVTIDEATHIGGLTIDSPNVLVWLVDADFSATDGVLIEQGEFGLSGGRASNTRFHGPLGADRLSISLGGVLENVELALDTYALNSVIRGTLTLDGASFKSVYGQLGAGSSITGQGQWRLGFVDQEIPFPSFFVRVPIESGGNFTLGDDVTMLASPYLTILQSIEGSTFTNRGTVVADSDDASMRFDLMDNSAGTIRVASGGQIRATLTGGAGKIVVEPGGEVFLSGEFDFTQPVVVEGGAALHLSGVTIRPSGPAIELGESGVLTLPAVDNVPDVVAAGGAVHLNSLYTIADIHSLPIQGTTLLKVGYSGTIDLGGAILDYTTLPQTLSLVGTKIRGGTLTGPSIPLDAGNATFTNLVMDVPTRVVGLVTFAQQSTLRAPVTVEGGTLSLVGDWSNEGSVVVESGSVLFAEAPTTPDVYGSFTFNGGEVQFGYSLTATEVLAVPFTLPPTTVIGKATSYQTTPTLDLENSVWDMTTAPTALVVGHGKLANGTVQGDQDLPGLHTLALRLNSFVESVAFDSLVLEKIASGGNLTNSTLRNVTIESSNQTPVLMLGGVLQDVVVNGRLEVSGPVEVNGTLEVNGLLGGVQVGRGSLESTSLLLASGATITGRGQIGNVSGRRQSTVIEIVDSAFVLPVDLTLVSATEYDSTSRINAPTTDLIIESDIVVGHSTAWLDRSDSWTFEVGSVRTSGKSTVNFDGRLTVEGGPWIHSGRMSLEDGLVEAESMMVTDKGTVAGHGAIVVTNGLEVGGTLHGIEAGQSLTIDGQLTLLPTASVEFSVAEVEGALLSTRLDVSDTVTLAGLLVVTVDPQSILATGDRLTLLTGAGGGSGTFDESRLPDASAGQQIQLLYGATAVELAIVIQGDYNTDGVVDAADYTVWRDSLGTTGVGLPADGNGDEVVNELDYNVWKMHFGETSTTGSADSAPVVPEPATVTLAIVGITSIACLRRRA